MPKGNVYGATRQGAIASRRVVPFFGVMRVVPAVRRGTCTVCNGRGRKAFRTRRRKGAPGPRNRHKLVACCDSATYRQEKAFRASGSECTVQWPANARHNACMKACGVGSSCPPGIVRRWKAGDVCSPAMPSMAQRAGCQWPHLPGGLPAAFGPNHPRRTLALGRWQSLRLGNRFGEEFSDPASGSRLGGGRCLVWAAVLCACAQSACGQWHGSPQRPDQRDRSPGPDRAARRHH